VASNDLDVHLPPIAIVQPPPDESRRLCIDTANKAGVDYDFYKDKKCADIK
jgi:hypothetical protein